MKETLVLILAGGVGKRLSILSQLRAKPAVPFAGLYRIIDFTLSNVMNSGLSHVAVLPQYKPLSLIEHIGIGIPWDFNGRTRSINILPPSTGRKDSDWYRGTADAIRQNLNYIQHYDAEYLLILSGDHIYNMDYSEMINFHRECRADVTIGMIHVPLKDANQFGIATLDSNSKIIDWTEKPEQPKSDLASMGIYVFTTKFLINQLQSLKGEDFGHDLIPVFVEKHNAFGYPFNNYWRDVGTVQAYWESNMEIFTNNSKVNLNDWNLATNFEEEGRVGDRPPAFISQTAQVSNSFIAHGCKIEGVVKNSVLSPGVHVGSNTIVENSVILHDTKIGKDTSLHYCVVDKDVKIGNKCKLGKPDADSGNLCLVGKRSIIPDNIQIGKFCKIFPKTDLSNYSHKEIPDFQEIGELL
jgi:glucose-1-phosphate adenylyltransferase